MQRIAGAVSLAAWKSDLWLRFCGDSCQSEEGPLGTQPDQHLDRLGFPFTLQQASASFQLSFACFLTSLVWTGLEVMACNFEFRQ